MAPNYYVHINCIFNFRYNNNDKDYFLTGIVHTICFSINCRYGFHSYFSKFAHTQWCNPFKIRCQGTHKAYLSWCHQNISGNSYLVYKLLTLTVNLVIEHKSDGCCGQEQIVLCKATEATVVDVFVEDKLLASYTYSKRNQVINEEGFSVRANATEVTTFLYNFDIEIVFTTMSEEVSITCDVLLFSVTKNVTANSRLCSMFTCKPFFCFKSGSNCLRIGPSTTSFLSITETKDGVTISTRLHEVIEPIVLSTLDCTATLQCLNCSYKRDMSFEQCEANVTLDSIPYGKYMLSLTIFSSCGEKIVAPSTLVTLGPGEFMTCNISPL